MGFSILYIYVEVIWIEAFVGWKPDIQSLGFLTYRNRYGETVIGVVVDRQ